MYASAYAHLERAPFNTEANNGHIRDISREFFRTRERGDVLLFPPLKEQTRREKAIAAGAKASDTYLFMSRSFPMGSSRICTRKNCKTTHRRGSTNGNPRARTRAIIASFPLHRSSRANDAFLHDCQRSTFPTDFQFSILSSQ